MKNLISLIFIIHIFLGVSRIIAQSETSVTIMSSGLGLVRESRTLEMDKGVQIIQLKDIPAKLDETSILVESKNDGFSLIEQNFQYDLADINAVLQKSLNRMITIIQPDQVSTDGRLLSFSESNLILQDGKDNLQIVSRNNQQKIILTNTSDNETQWITEPTLIWKVKSSKKGKQDVKLSFLCNGLSWQADYIGKLNEDDTKMTISARVSLDNTSGKSFRNAALKLMAGDLNIVDQGPKRFKTTRAMELTMQAESGFEERSFFDYHIYTLRGKTNLLNGQKKQIQLVPESVTDVIKKYRVNSYQPDQVVVVVSFENSEKYNLGIPLPAGKIRLYKSEGDDLEFIGEDNVQHTPADEKMDITVGKAFDIISERNISSTQKLTRRSQQQTVEYTIRNHKEKAVQVEIMERLPRNQEAELIKSNYKMVEQKAGYFKFRVPVKEKSETNLVIEYKTKW